MSALRVPSKADIVSKGRRLSDNQKILRTSFELVQSEGGEGGGRGETGGLTDIWPDEQSSQSVREGRSVLRWVVTV